MSVTDSVTRSGSVWDTLVGRLPMGVLLTDATGAVLAGNTPCRW